MGRPCACNKFRWLWPWLSPLIFTIVKPCPHHVRSKNLCTIAPNIIKLGKWKHHAKAMCCITKFRSLWPSVLHLTFMIARPCLSMSCPEQNFCILAPMIIKLGMWMHHGKVVCCIPNLGHCDLTFDLYDSKSLSTLCPEQNFCTAAPRIMKLGMWMLHMQAMCLCVTFQI